MNKFIMLVGVPASGKSTWMESYLKLPENVGLDWEILSTDSYIENYANERLMTYNEAFKIKGMYAQASNHLNERLKDAIARGANIIWDQTNTTVNSRVSKLRCIPESYNKIAVFLVKPDNYEHGKRLNSRPGKIIPEAVMRSMNDNLEIPTKEEGFEEIICVHT